MQFKKEMSSLLLSLFKNTSLLQSRVKDFYLIKSELTHSSLVLIWTRMTWFLASKSLNEVSAKYQILGVFQMLGVVGFDELYIFIKFIIFLWFLVLHLKYHLSVLKKFI